MKKNRARKCIKCNRVADEKRLDIIQARVLTGMAIRNSGRYIPLEKGQKISVCLHCFNSCFHGRLSTQKHDGVKLMYWTIGFLIITTLFYLKFK